VASPEGFHPANGRKEMSSRARKSQKAAADSAAVERAGTAAYLKSYHENIDDIRDFRKYLPNVAREIEEALSRNLPREAARSARSKKRASIRRRNQLEKKGPVRVQNRGKK
jgi:hypothetical protein